MSVIVCLGDFFFILDSCLAIPFCGISSGSTLFAQACLSEYIQKIPYDLPIFSVIKYLEIVFNINICINI